MFESSIIEFRVLIWNFYLTIEVLDRDGRIEFLDLFFFPLPEVDRMIRREIELLNLDSSGR